MVPDQIVKNTTKLAHSIQDGETQVQISGTTSKTGNLYCGNEDQAWNYI